MTIYDTTPTPPVDYDQSKVPEPIKRRADYVRTKYKGGDILEATAQNAEIAGIYAGEAKQLTERTEIRQDAVEDFTAQSVAQMQAEKDAVIANATVDSEVILARGGKPTLQARLDDTTEQLAQNDIKAMNNFVETNRTNMGNHAMMTFVDDDYHYEGVMNDLAPIFKEKGVPLVVAMYYDNTNKTIRAELREHKDEHGWEIAWHSKNNGYLERDYSDEQLHADFQFAQQLNTDEGLEIENLVYPHGNTSPRVAKIASQYFKSGVWTYGGLNGQNNFWGTDLRLYRLNRTPFGAYHYDWTVGDTLEGYKAHIDEAIATNGWVIWMTHAGDPNHTPQHNEWLAELIDYAKSKQMPIVTLKEGLKRRGQLQKGDSYEKKKDFFILNSDGTIQSNSAITYRENGNPRGVNVYTDFRQFRVGVITYTEYEEGGTSSGIAGDYGVLETYRSSGGTSGYQIWRPSNSNYIYRRGWNNETKEWRTFQRDSTYSRSDTLYPNPATTNFGFETPPNGFLSREPLSFYVDQPDSPHKPTSSRGIGVITNYLFGRPGSDYQIFKEHDQPNIYVRNTSTNTSWGNWVKFTGVSV